MSNSPFMKAVDIISQLQLELEMLRRDAEKFDKGNDKAGQRLRKHLNQFTDNVHVHRKAIQKQRYYRDAWKYYYGQITWIDGLEYKEKTHGSVAEVVRLQITQKFKA